MINACAVQRGAGSGATAQAARREGLPVGADAGIAKAAVLRLSSDHILRGR